MAVRRTVFANNPRGVANVTNLAVTNLHQFFKKVDGESIKILEEAGDIIIEETEPFVPEDTTALLKSAKKEVTIGPKGPKLTVSYGDETPVIGKHSPQGIVSYAVIVHEDLARTKGGQKVTYKKGGPKFLDKGGKAALPKITRKFIENLPK